MPAGNMDIFLHMLSLLDVAIVSYMPIANGRLVTYVGRFDKKLQISKFNIFIFPLQFYLL
jgi:hypothetical protein